MSKKNKKTLVLGASANPARYSFLAIQSLRNHGYEVVAIGARKAQAEDVAITTETLPITDLDTVTLYLSKKHQEHYYDYILALNPKRIIFNPGAENDELGKLAKTNGIEVMEACTLVMLTTGQF